jgi:hypothetical protein
VDDLCREAGEWGKGVAAHPKLAGLRTETCDFSLDQLYLSIQGDICVRHFVRCRSGQWWEREKHSHRPMASAIDTRSHDQMSASANAIWQTIDCEVHTVTSNMQVRASARITKLLDQWVNEMCYK